MPIFWCLVDPPKAYSLVGLIKPCHLLIGLFWDAMDSFAGLFDGFYYTLTGESTSKADKFDNFCRRKSQTCLLHKGALGSELREMYWTKPSKQKGVNLEGLGGWRFEICIYPGGFLKRCMSVSSMKNSTLYDYTDSRKFDKICCEKRLT